MQQQLEYKQIFVCMLCWKDLQLKKQQIVVYVLIMVNHVYRF